MTKKDKPKHDEPVQTQDTGNGNPPPKKPPESPTPTPDGFSIMGDGTGESSEDTGNGNPPPKG